MDVNQFAHAFGTGTQEQYAAQRLQDMKERVLILTSLIEMLETEIQLKAEPAASDRSFGSKVFLVHGHDELAKHEVARFIESLDLAAVILHEQPNRGRTIIEKFIDNSDVGFAVVLMTADDRGGVTSATCEEQQPRTRQNVILELGFFLGSLGRKRVCVLYQEGVEIPSDYSGVLFVPLDKGGVWKLQLAKEMKAAEMPVDMNKAL